VLHLIELEYRLMSRIYSSGSPRLVTPISQLLISQSDMSMIDQ